MSAEHLCFPYSVVTMDVDIMSNEPVAWMHNLLEDNIIAHRPFDLDRHPDRWTPLYKNPTPCETCQALARTVMMDQTSHDTHSVDDTALLRQVLDDLCASRLCHLNSMSSRQEVERLIDKAITALRERLGEKT